MDTVIRIDGMTCGGCAKSVEKALGAVNGVKSVKVDLDAKTATVAASDTVTVGALNDAVEDAGYDVVR